MPEMPVTTETKAIVVPYPDPTTLTTQQLLREVSTSRELVESMITGGHRNIETRFMGMDKAIELVKSSTEMFPKQIESGIERLQQLHEEKFLSIANQFNLRDVAVAAALKAAQEAVFAQQVANDRANTKMETAFEKRIEALADLLVQVRDGLTDKIEDSKSRLTTMESRKEGEGGARKGMGDIFGYLLGGVGLLIALAALFLKVH
jgi:hypothetical protein